MFNDSRIPLSVTVVMRVLSVAALPTANERTDHEGDHLP